MLWKILKIEYFWVGNKRVVDMFIYEIKDIDGLVKRNCFEFVLIKIYYKFV